MQVTRHSSVHVTQPVRKRPLSKQARVSTFPAPSGSPPLPRNSSTSHPLGGKKITSTQTRQVRYQHAKGHPSSFSQRVSFYSSHQDKNLTKSSELTPTASIVPPDSPLKPDKQERGQSNPPPRNPKLHPLHPAHPRAEQLEVTQPLALTVKRAGPGHPNHPKQGKPAQRGEPGK